MAQVTRTYQSFAQPDFAAEQLTPEKLLPAGGRVDATVFNYVDAVVVKLAAAALADATSLTVDAVTMANAASTKTGNVIPVGTNLYFGESKEFARVTTAVALGATSIAVQALPTALEDNDEATYNGLDIRKPIPAGTLVGRTFAERTSSAAYGLPDVATPDDELYLTAFTVQDAVENPDVTLLRHGTLIYEDKLPGWAGLSTAIQAAIRTRYQCITQS